MVINRTVVRTVKKFDNDHLRAWLQEYGFAMYCERYSRCSFPKTKTESGIKMTEIQTPCRVKYIRTEKGFSLITLIFYTGLNLLHIIFKKHSFFYVQKSFYKLILEQWALHYIVNKRI